MKLVITGIRYLLGFSILVTNGLVVLPLYLLSFGQLRRFNTEVINPICSKTILFIFGLRFDIVNEHLRPRKPCIYMFNHNSTLDIFMFGALGLANTHVIISVWTKKFLPITLINWGSGSYFIPMKSDPGPRIAFFRKIIHFLNQGNASVICSPEGVQPSIHGIAKFNKGVFRIATETHRPIAPLFFEISEKLNPLQGYNFKKGQIKAHFMPLIPTKDWKLEDLENNKSAVRAIFVEKFNSTFPEAKTL